jgi:hypothetical protein
MLAALAAIGVRLWDAEYLNSNWHSDANTYTSAIFASAGFSDR